MWNRRKRRARAPRTTVPLTADMLNELDKSHMAGVDNYGVEDVYDPDDAWNNEKVTYDRRLVSAATRGRRRQTSPASAGDFGPVHPFEIGTFACSSSAEYHQP